jgi:hypothetical protein
MPDHDWIGAKAKAAVPRDGMKPAQVSKPSRVASSPPKQTEGNARVTESNAALTSAQRQAAWRKANRAKANEANRAYRKRKAKP